MTNERFYVPAGYDEVLYNHAVELAHENNQLIDELRAGHYGKDMDEQRGKLKANNEICQTDRPWGSGKFASASRNRS